VTFATVSTPPAPLARLLSAFQHDPRSLPRLLDLSNALSTARDDVLRGAHPLGAALQEVEPVVRRARSPLAGCSLPDAFRHLWALVADGKRLPLGPFGFSQRPRLRFFEHPAKGAPRLQASAPSTTTLGHGPRQFGVPCTPRFGDSARVFPPRAARDASVTGNGRLASTGTSPLPLPARPTP